MSGEKTEPPTPKRLNEARKKGQVFKSNDLTQAFLFLTAAGVLSAGGSTYVTELRQLMADFFQPLVLSGNLPAEEMLRRTGHGFSKFLLLTAPLLGALFIVSGAAGFMQVKALFAPEVLKPKLDKMNPLKGFQNLFFKARTYLELFKNLVKFAVVLYLVYRAIMAALPDVVLAMRLRLDQVGMLASDLMFNLLYTVGAAFIVLGAVDFMLQKKQYMKGMMMSKYEVEKEYKESEGDPHIKHMRKQIHEEMAAHGMTDSVPKADAIVVNPTHLAVAIKYDERTMNAPKVTAKGQESMAERIIELAKKHRVPVVRNVGLAQSLFEIEVGRDIPEDLYEAVAEVLNWVYQMAEMEAT